MRILVVEDDAALADAISGSLRHHGYAVDVVGNGSQADHALKDEHFDLAILDIGLPGIDGFEVLRRLRQRKSVAPVLMLTARDATTDRVNGLNLGADDYLVKPFDMQELQARVRALLRRSTGAVDERLTFGPLVFQLDSRTVHVGAQRLELSGRETQILETLMKRAGNVVSKSVLMQRSYTWDDEVAPNAVEVQIHRLRKKLAPSGVEIQTVRGLGYLLQDAAHRANDS